MTTTRVAAGAAAAWLGKASGAHIERVRCALDFVPLAELARDAKVFTCDGPPC
jgi:hypothetical protein